MPDDVTGPTPAFRTVTVSPGVNIAFEEWPTAGPRILFLHATGFSRGCWRPHATRLASRATPTLLDLRGHGSSSKPPEPYRWSHFVDDVVALVLMEGWDRLILCGHSVGGATAIQVAARLPEQVSALVLIEPVVPQPAGRSDAAVAPSPLIERTLRRRMRWDSRDKAAEYLRARAPYDSWDSAVFTAWVETGLTASADGCSELSCPPWVEASVFEETRGSGATADLAQIRVPTWIARATGDRGMRSTCGPEVAHAIAGAHEVIVEGSGHFLPMEDIPLVVRLIDEACTATGG